jgi:hypothetical protein
MKYLVYGLYEEADTAPSVQEIPLFKHIHTEKIQKAPVRFVIVVCVPA